MPEVKYRITSAGVPVEIDGEPRLLRFDATAMADFDQASGRGDGAAFKLFTGAFAGFNGEADVAALIATLGLSGKDLQALAWACLGGEDGTMTLREAGRLFSAENIGQIITPLLEAVQGALPEAKPEDESHPPPEGETPGPDG